MRSKSESWKERWCHFVRLLLPKVWMSSSTCWVDSPLVHLSSRRQRISDPLVIFFLILKWKYSERTFFNEETWIMIFVLWPMLYFYDMLMTEPQIIHLLISLFNSLTSIPCYNLSHSVKTITILPWNSWIMPFRCWGEIC